MALYDWVLPADYPRCLEADNFHRDVRDCMFRHITGPIPPEYGEKLKERLRTLRDEQVSRLSLFHYAAASGPRHQCVEDVFRQAVSRLDILVLTTQAQPHPQPAPDSARQAPITADAVVTNLRRVAEYQTRRRDTYLGQEIPPSTDGSRG
jgi:hypothetical protein